MKINRDMSAQTVGKLPNWSAARPQSIPLTESHPRPTLTPTPMTILAGVSHTSRLTWTPSRTAESTSMEPSLVPGVGISIK